MSQLKQSTARDKMIFMTDSADHVTGKTGLTLTITLSKNGGAFASISPTVTERGNGWYSLALTSSHTDTLGDFVVRATATGADAADIPWEVVAGLPGETVTLAAVTHTGAVIPTVTTLTGHTAQSGDAYARLGAPAGASVSADVAAVKAETASIQSDTNDIQTRLPAALVGGRMDSNLSAIDNQATSGNNATLYLKRLDIQNSTGVALKIAGTATDTNTVEISANNGTGDAINISATSGDGIHASTIAGVGVKIENTTGGVGLHILGGSVGGDAVRFQSRGSNGPNNGLTLIGTVNGAGLSAAGHGTGPGITSTGGATGNGATFSGGATSGKGIDANGTGGSADIEGNITGNVTGSVNSVTSDVNISTTAIAAIWAYVVTGTTSAVQLMRGFAAALMGKSSGHETNTPKYRDLGDTKNVIDATTDANGNRTAVTKDLS